MSHFEFCYGGNCYRRNNSKTLNYLMYDLYCYLTDDHIAIGIFYPSTKLIKGKFRNSFTMSSILEIKV